MAANLYCTGPVYVYVRIPPKGAGPRQSPVVGGNGAEFLGTAETNPNVEFIQGWAAVMNDLGGPERAFDKISTGEQPQMVEVDLDRFDYTVFNKVTNYPRNGRNNAGANPRGSNTRLDIGLFALANGATVECWLYYTFYNTVNSLDYPELIPGYYFPSCTIKGYAPTPSGTQVHKCRIMIDPLPWWQVSTGSFMLYSNDPAYFANLPAIT